MDVVFRIVVVGSVRMRMKETLVLLLLLLTRDASAFVSTSSSLRHRQEQLQVSSVVPPSPPPRRSCSTTSSRTGTTLLQQQLLPHHYYHPSQHQHHHVIGQHVIRTTFAGRVWPTLKKFRIGPQKATEIWSHIGQIAQWQGVVFLVLVAYGTLPLTQFLWERGSEKQPAGSSVSRRDWSQLRRRQVATVLAGGAKVALSAYAVDLVCVALTSLGFAFPSLWDIPAVYSKTAYSLWALQRFLQFKTAALCRWYKVPSADQMTGKMELINRALGALSVSMVTLFLLDWLSIKMGMALKGLVAFGSVGTLAFTFASQDVVSQFISGIFLSASNKVYSGDDVVFGDGTKGTILKLGWMDTVLRGGDNSITSVPNSKLANQKVSNLSRVRISQVAQTLRFHYENADDIPALLESIKQEIQTECPRLITDGSRPFRVFWTGFKEDYLEVMVDAHFQIPPIGDAYWINRQRVLIAINRAVKQHNLQFAKLHRVEAGQQQPVWRVVVPATGTPSLMPQQQQQQPVLREPQDATNTKATSTHQVPSPPPRATTSAAVVPATREQHTQREGPSSTILGTAATFDVP